VAVPCRRANVKVDCTLFLALVSEADGQGGGGSW